MQSRLAKLLNRFIRCERGGALAELAIMVPFLALMLAGVSEFGRYFQNYTTLAKATRNASRYLSNHDLNATEEARAVNLVVCGKLACGAGDAPLVKGLSSVQRVSRIVWFTKGPERHGKDSLRRRRIARRWMVQQRRRLIPIRRSSISARY
jgi:hypothetical protein